MTRHAIARAKERYGIELTKKDIAAIGERITNGEGVILARDTHHGAERVLIDHAGTALIVVFAPRTNTIVTIYPKGSSYKFRRRRHQTRQTRNKLRRKAG